MLEKEVGLGWSLAKLIKICVTGNVILEIFLLPCHISTDHMQHVLFAGNKTAYAN